MLLLMKRILYGSAVGIVGLASFALIATFSPGGEALAIRHQVPRVETYAATNITTNSAQLNGWVRGNGAGEGHVWFEYGTNPLSGNYGTSWPGKAGVMGIKGGTLLRHSVTVNDLQPNTTYYYRIKAENQFGNNPANVKSFKTKASGNSTCNYNCNTNKNNSSTNKPSTTTSSNTNNYNYTNNTTNNTQYNYNYTYQYQQNNQSGGNVVSYKGGN
jgi:hypothetical protein